MEKILFSMNIDKIHGKCDLAYMSHNIHHTHDNITYDVNVFGQFMQELLIVHWKGALGILTYIKHAP